MFLNGQNHVENRGAVCAWEIVCRIVLLWTWRAASEVKSQDTDLALSSLLTGNVSVDGPLLELVVHLTELGDLKPVTSILNDLSKCPIKAWSEGHRLQDVCVPVNGAMWIQGTRSVMARH